METDLSTRKNIPKKPANKSTKETGIISGFFQNVQNQYGD